MLGLYRRHCCLSSLTVSRAAQCEGNSVSAGAHTSFPTPTLFHLAVFHSAHFHSAFFSGSVHTIPFSTHFHSAHFNTFHFQQFFTQPTSTLIIFTLLPQIFMFVNRFTSFCTHVIHLIRLGALLSWKVMFHSLIPIPKCY